MKKQIILFLFTGIVNTVFYYLLFSLFIWIGLEYKFAVLIATIIGVAFSFNTFGRFVFLKINKLMFAKFIIVYTVLYFINIFIIKVLNGYLYNYYISGFISAIICAGISFLLNKFFVYK
jgi:putative flippase GtrA